MKKFIKKNIEVQAVQYDGMPESLEELVTLGLEYRLGEDSSITIVTQRGEVTGEIGDYILMSVTGDFEICNQDKFQKMYSEDKDEQISVTETSDSNEQYSEAELNNYIKEYPKNKDKILKTLRKELVHIIFWFLDLLIVIFLPFVSDICVRRSIKTTVEYIYKDEIQRESGLLLEKTKAQACEIIEQAKKDAITEADEAFRKEMERLTNERVKK